MLKTCSRCNLEKPISEMGVDKRSSTGIGVWCVSCHKSYTREYWDKNRSKMIEKSRLHRQIRHAWLATLKSKPCVDCGQVFPPEAMDFDHVVGGKVKGVGRMTTHHPNAILAEMAKCDLVCGNCHRVRTTTRNLAKPLNTTNAVKRWSSFIAKIREVKSNPCVDCGGTFIADVMEFDHVRGEKMYSVSKMHTLPWGKVCVEIDKCELVCCNCHRIRTQSRRSAPNPIGVP